MCGIAGVAYRDTDRPTDAATIQVMTQLLRHRGPDSEGVLAENGIGLGSSRLRIIDPEDGDQPQFNEDKSIVLICNGEIYNYVELRRDLLAAGHQFRTQSDTEVILHLYEDLGVDCVNRLRGMFAFAVWDSDQKTLFLARDRLGIKPLYYAEAQDGLYFSSEQKSILAVAPIEHDVDPEALSSLLTLGFVASPMAMFRSIRQLPPGHSLMFRDGCAKVDEYWDVQFPLRNGFQNRSSVSGWAEALREKLEETTLVHLRSDAPLGAWLSGGLDSSAIVALMARCLLKPICVSALSFEDRDIDEIYTQTTLLDFPQYNLVPRIPVCTRRDFERLPEVMWYFEDPTTSGLEIIRALISESSAQDVKVVLTGEGADEVFGGYPWFRSNKLLRPLSYLPLPLRKAARFAPFVLKKYGRASRLVQEPPEINANRYRIHIHGMFGDTVERLLSSDIRRRLLDGEVPTWQPRMPEGFDRWHPFNQLQYYDLKVRLPSFVLPLADRGSMAKSLEARVPFLDHELVELAAQIPPHLKMRCLREKHILRRAAADLLPPQVVTRRKRGLRAPVHRWLEDPLPEFAEDLLSRSALRRKGYFNPEGVRQALAERRSGNTSHSWELLGVIGVQLWDELFMQGNGPSLR